MSILPNFFSDPVLRERQVQLDGQWKGLWGTYNSSCDNGLGSAFPEFATDYNGWREFFDSESDWSSASTNATNEWQRKAQEWAKRLKDYGCGDSDKGDLGIPGVKDPPADDPGLLSKLANAAEKPFDYIKNLTYGVLILIAIAVVAIFWLVSKKSISTAAGSIS